MDPRHDEVNWRKSTRCASGACVEVATAEAGRLVRDSKLMEASPILNFGTQVFQDFLGAVKAGEFDLH